MTPIYIQFGEGASLALVGHPSSGGVKIKMPYGEGQMFYIDQLRTPFFPIGLGWLKLKIRSVETGLGR